MKIVNVYFKVINYQQPEVLFQKYKKYKYSALLTGRGLADISKYSLVGAFPYAIVKKDNDNFKIFYENDEISLNSSFFRNFEQVWEKFNFSEFKYPINKCGAIGYLSYEALHEIEKIEKQTENSYNLPILQMIIYNKYFLWNHENEKCYEIDLQFEKESKIVIEKEFSGSFKVDNVELESTKNEYMEKVRKIQDYIVEGDVYEVNLTQQIRADFSGDSFELFKKLYSINSAPYSAYLNFDEADFICNSPESFILAEDRKISTRPIKGTISRGKTEEEDVSNQNILLNSKKDEAELFMIIDLLRNDIGKVCEYGSVEVINPKRLEKYNNVYHLVGIIEGILAEKFDYVDLIKATFPGGSITGCPKIRCMEIIEELETYSRNLYTGTIFILNKKYFNSNIVIRSAVVQNGKIFMNSGGAITIDSKPKDEYDEIIHKIKNLLESGGYEYDHLLL